MPAPILISQINVMALCGIDPRRFLDVVRDRKLPHGRVGKLVLVDVEVLREALLDVQPAPLAKVDEADIDQDEDEGEVDALAAIGRRRVSP